MSDRNNDHPPIDGFTYSPEQDGERLGRQLDEVNALMSDGRWRTLAEIGGRVQGSEASLSARLRDLRKEKFGGLTVERRRRDGAPSGVWEYRVAKEFA